MNTLEQSAIVGLTTTVVLLAGAWTYILTNPVEDKVSFNDGTMELCYTVTVSPYADRETTVAALKDTATIVRRNGCANIQFDSGVRPDKHYIDLAK